jgi:hypothetical protein
VWLLRPEAVVGNLRQPAEMVFYDLPTVPLGVTYERVRHAEMPLLLFTFTLLTTSNILQPRHRDSHSPPYPAEVPGAPVLRQGRKLAAVETPNIFFTEGQRKLDEKMSFADRFWVRYNS